MNRLAMLWLAMALGICLPRAGFAGGSGLNVFIVVNQNSSNSVQLGNYYRERRNVPPQNFLRVNWPGGNIVWTNSDLTATVLDPLLSALSSRGLTNQIDYVVLSMDFPYRVMSGDSAENSTTSTLFYGFWPDSNPPCTLAEGSSNAYAASEGIFRLTPPINPASNSFLAFMITDTNLAAAENTIDDGVAGDSTFPSNTVYLTKSTDTARNVRYIEFDNTIFNSRLLGRETVVRTNLDNPGNLTGLLGLVASTANVPLANNAFIPGAMADTLTSFGGLLFENPGQTVLLSFLEAGASGSYGSITEGYEDICNYPQKFPDTQNYFYQARGFSLGESYYMSLTNPYQGLLVGEPLSAPFAAPASASWSGLSSNALLRGTTNLSLQFAGADALHPVQQVDLFVDGLWFETLTNIPPRAGDVLNVSVGGHAASYAVGAGETIKSVTSNLVAVLNSPAYANLAKISTEAHGDRVLLRSLDTSRTGAQVPITAGPGTPRPQSTTYIASSRGSFLDSIAQGMIDCVIQGTPGVGDTLSLAVTKTNGTLVTVSVTNTSGLALLPFTQQFFDAINSTPALEGPDGLTGTDLEMDSGTIVDFNLLATGQGYAAAQIQVNPTATGGLSVAWPPGATTLTANLYDLQPRDHFYITAGASNLAFAFPLNTAALSDGWHELESVAYEGTHVRTQARATQTVHVQNTALSASLVPLLGGSNTDVGATLQFQVTASTNNISRIELFSTGGSIGVATNQSSAVFSVAGSNLGLGLHPFYAVVTASNGQSYRTATTWVRLIGPEPAFTLSVTAPPVTLRWPATAGRSYDILSTPNLAAPFQFRASVVPTNSQASWTEPSPATTQLFYRIRVTP